jgi:hypothetical protein
MALTSAQISNLLFKKIIAGKSSTSDARQFFEEPFDGRSIVFPSQIWVQIDQIPNTAPVLADTQTVGVVQYFQNLTLTAVPGTTGSFHHSNLVNAIPFNFGDGVSYNYSIKDFTGAAIPFGTSDWVLDIDAGVLTFYNGVPGNMPPKISFYKYVGTTGASSGIFDQTPRTVITRTVIGGEASAKQITLPFEPSDPSAVIFSVQGGPLQFLGDDYTVTGVTLSWAGLGLDGLIDSGDTIRIEL